MEVSHNVMEESGVVYHGVEKVDAEIKDIANRIPKNKSNLIPYEALPEERDEVNSSINKASAYLPPALLFVGAHELFSASLYKSAVMEIIGSIGQCYFHIAIVLGSQAFTYPPAVIGFVSALVIALYIYQFAMTSGAHFNPLITMASMASGHLPIVRGLLYIGCQVLGWYIGAEIMRASVSRDLALSVGLGACSPGDKTYEQAFAIEFMCSFMLLFPVYGTAFNLRQREVFGPIYPPILIGMTLGMLVFCSASLGSPPFTGAGMNPSLCSGIALSLANIAGVENGEVFRHHSVYWLAPMTAAVTNAILYTIMPPHHDVLDQKS
eukprot:gene15499-17358_t